MYFKHQIVHRSNNHFRKLMMKKINDVKKMN